MEVSKNKTSILSGGREGKDARNSGRRMGVWGTLRQYLRKYCLIVMFLECSGTGPQCTLVPFATLLPPHQNTAYVSSYAPSPTAFWWGGLYFEQGGCPQFPYSPSWHQGGSQQYNEVIGVLWGFLVIYNYVIIMDEWKYPISTYGQIV